MLRLHSVFSPVIAHIYGTPIFVDTNIFLLLVIATIKWRSKKRRIGVKILRKTTDSKETGQIHGEKAKENIAGSEIFIHYSIGNVL